MKPHKVMRQSNSMMYPPDTKGLLIETRASPPVLPLVSEKDSNENSGGDVVPTIRNIIQTEPLKDTQKEPKPAKDMNREKSNAAEMD